MMVSYCVTADGGIFETVLDCQLCCFVADLRTNLFQLLIIRQLINYVEYSSLLAICCI